MDAINIVEKWNDIVKVKQGGRLIGFLSCISIGTYLLYKFAFQDGITYEQKYLTKAFPEEYGSMTNKILKEVELHYGIKNES